MITRLELKKFTAFTDLTIDFSPKINVIIGENGNGKTQLLKSVYALCGGGALQVGSTGNELALALTRKLVRLLMPLDDKLGNMRRPGARGNAQLKATFALGEELALTFNGSSEVATVNSNAAYANYRAEPIFVPTKEVLSLVRGMTDANHDQRTVELIFDDGYLDLAQMLLRKSVDDPESRINLDPRFDSIVPKLANLIGGRYQLENGGFSFQSGTYVETLGQSSAETKAPQVFQKATTRFVPAKTAVLSSGMTAEGFRKIGMLQRLLTNGTLNPGVSGPLLWDEPESNLNPKLMKLLVEILLELSRNGQQVILATHDYVLLKWIDLLMNKGKGDHVMFHALYRDEKTGEVKADSMDDYRAITPNAIADTFNDLTKEQVNRKMGGLGK
ncbi:ATP/GTP-binding protein [Pseudomonas sp. B21128]|uniref:AAA family ATPase n=1 Tax=Pseudomonas sp. B21128 TaxID=3235110 RepID=UPI0037835DF6